MFCWDFQLAGAASWPSLRPHHVPPSPMYDDALKSMAFTAQISYSHEKQFRVIPIIIIVVLVVAYSRKVYREFISFLAHSAPLGLGRGEGTGGPTVTRHRSSRDLSRQRNTTNNIIGEIRPESDVKTRQDLKLKNHHQCVAASLEGSSVVGRKLSLIFLMVCCYEAADPIYFVSTRRRVVVGFFWCWWLLGRASTTPYPFTLLHRNGMDMDCQWMRSHCY